MAWETAGEAPRSSRSPPDLGAWTHPKSWKTGNFNGRYSECSASVFRRDFSLINKVLMFYSFSPFDQSSKTSLFLVNTGIGRDLSSHTCPNS